MKHKGLLLVMLTTLISGVSVFANAQLVKGIDPIVHTTIKNGLVGLMIVGWMMVTHKFSGIKKLSINQWLKLIVVALVGGSVSFGLFFTGLKIIGAGEGALIHKTMVVWITLLAIPLLREKISWPMMMAVVGLYASNLIGSTGFNTLKMAHLMVLGATLLWSVETILVKKFIKDIPVDVLLFGRMGIGSSLLVMYMFLTGKMALVTQINVSQWQGMFLVSLLLFGYVMTWYRALKFAPVIQVSSILVGATVITTVLTGVSAGTLGAASLIQSVVISGIVSMIVVRFSRSSQTKPVLIS